MELSRNTLVLIGMIGVLIMAAGIIQFGAWSIGSDLETMIPLPNTLPPLPLKKMRPADFIFFRILPVAFIVAGIIFIAIAITLNK